jgi:hypothetical protein
MVRTVAALMVAGSLIAVGCEEKSAPAPAKPATPAGATTTKPAEAPKPAATEAPKPAVPAVPAAALPDLGKASGEWTGKVDALVKSVTDAKAPAGLPAPAQKAFDEGKAAVVKAAEGVKAEIAKLKDAKPEGAKGLLDTITSKFGDLEKSAKEFLAKKWDAAPAAPAAPAGGK